jgi:hypothetical protein
MGELLLHSKTKAEVLQKAIARRLEVIELEIAASRLAEEAIAEAKRELTDSYGRSSTPIPDGTCPYQIHNFQCDCDPERYAQPPPEFQALEAGELAAARDTELLLRDVQVSDFEIDQCLDLCSCDATTDETYHQLGCDLIGVNTRKRKRETCEHGTVIFNPEFTECELCLDAEMADDPDAGLENVPYLLGLTDTLVDLYSDTE